MASRPAAPPSRNPLVHALETTARELGRRRASWALVGGLAVGARAEPRTTRDIDLAVPVPDDARAERLIHGLQAGGFRVLAAVEHEAAHRLATVRLAPPHEGPGGVVVDVLFASCGIEPEIAAAAEPLEIVRGLVVPVARIGHLLAMKVLARDDRRRPQDLEDIRALLAEASGADLEDARQALALIQERGFARGRRLVPRLRTLVRELGR